MSDGPRRPRPPLLGWSVFVVLGVLAWEASGAQLGAAAHRGALDRTVALLTAFARPDLSVEALRDGLWLSVQTVAVAAWGTALGAALGFGLGLGASDRIAYCDGRPRAWSTRIRVELVRGVLDGLRAIPDFAWALVVLVFVGAGPVTGMLAIALSVTGLLGRIYSQVLDATPADRTRVVEATGASRGVVALWGYVPAAAGPMLSYTLLRFECSMRNASVIGLVGGGGLGAALFEELGFGRYDRVATLLLFLLALTALTDVAAKQIADRLRTGARPTRRRLWGWLGVGLCASAVVLGPGGPQAVAELSRLDAAFLAATVDGLLALDLGPQSLRTLLVQAVVPLGIAYLATVLATGAAVGLLLLVPRTRPWAGASAGIQRAHHLLRRLLDAVALLARAIPDVVWLLLFGVALRVGPLAAIAAIATHSFGLLARLFAEAVDDVSPARIAPVALGSPRVTFAWGVWPQIAPTVWTHVSLQAESNLRAGLIVGIVGAGGLGDAFHDSITFWRLGEASMQALAMIGLTLVVDRLARRVTAAVRR
ncbi:MAG: ABC transporter permease subunit [Myxococcota bacterium]